MPEPEINPHTVTTAHSDDLFDVRPSVTLRAIDFWERDLRAVLNYYEHDYLPPDLVRSVRRLRLLVGR